MISITRPKGDGFTIDSTIKGPYRRIQRTLPNSGGYCRGVILMAQKLGFFVGFAAVLIFGPVALIVMAVIWLLGLIFKD